MSVFLYALRGDTRPGYISGGGGGWCLRLWFVEGPNWHHVVLRVGHWKAIHLGFASAMAHGSAELAHVLRNRQYNSIVPKPLNPKPQTLNPKH